MQAANPLWIARDRTSQPVLSRVELALASREIEGESGGCEAQGY